MFEMHMLNEKGKEEMKTFKSGIASAVKPALDMMQEGREKSVFKTKIEEAVFFGAKAITSKPGNFDSVTEF